VTDTIGLAVSSFTTSQSMETKVGRSVARCQSGSLKKMGGLSATIHGRSSASVNSTSTQPGCGSSDIHRHRSARSITTRCYLRLIRRELVTSPSGVVVPGPSRDRTEPACRGHIARAIEGLLLDFGLVEEWMLPFLAVFPVGNDDELRYERVGVKCQRYVDLDAATVV
jgi:hypothetical protein